LFVCIDVIVQVWDMLAVFGLICFCDGHWVIQQQCKTADRNLLLSLFVLLCCCCCC